MKSWAAKLARRVPQHFDPFSWSEPTQQAELGHRADFGECLLLGLSRRSCSTPAHHSKRALRFSISTFLIGCLGPFPEIPCGSKMLVCSSEADPQPTLRTQRKPGPKQKAPEVIITISFLWACSDHHSWVLVLQPLQGYDPAAGDRVLHRPELPFPPRAGRMEKST